LWGSDESNQGSFLMILRMFECENSWFLKKEITELGFSRVLKRTCLLLKALRADSYEKPKLLMRYDTANGGVSDSDDDGVVVVVVVVVVVQYLSEIGNEKC
jgi:glutaredoxin 2